MRDMDHSELVSISLQRFGKITGCYFLLYAVETIVTAAPSMSCLYLPISVSCRTLNKPPPHLLRRDTQPIQYPVSVWQTHLTTVSAFSLPLSPLFQHVSVSDNGFIVWKSELITPPHFMRTANTSRKNSLSCLRAASYLHNSSAAHTANTFHTHGPENVVSVHTFTLSHTCKFILSQ